MSAPTEEAQERRLTSLMIAYQGGDLSAFEQLYVELLADLRRYFEYAQRDRAGVHDLVQDVFLEMHRSRRTYSPPLPVRPWVFGIARNVLARGRRAASLRARNELELEPDAELHIAAPDSGIPAAEALDIERALAGLPVSVREPWLLHHWLGFNFDSIAERLGISTMAAKLRSSRATRALRGVLSVTRRSER